MSWSFDPSAWTDGVTIPHVADFQNIATDLHKRGAVVDGGGYGRANTGFLTLVGGAFPGTTYTVTAGSWSAGVATLTIGAHVILVGQLVTISTVVPTGYNASVIVTAVTATQISYALSSNPGAYTSGGSVLVGGVVAANGMLAVDGSGALNYRQGGTFSPLGGSGFSANSRAYIASAQSIPNNAETAISFDTNAFDVGSIHSTSVNPTRFTIPQTGVYALFGLYRAASNATGTRYATIKKNGSTYSSINWATAASGSDTSINVGLIDTLTAADYIELYAFQTSGGALNAVGGLSNTFMSLARIG